MPLWRCSEHPWHSERAIRHNSREQPGAAQKARQESGERETARVVAMTRLALTHPQAQAVDGLLDQAHRAYQNEYARQLEMYRTMKGRYPYYNYEFAAVASKAMQAISAAHRAILGG
jgi:hypothetical protein